MSESNFSSSKNKEVCPEKISNISGNEAPKKLLIFSQKKAFLIFPETETSKKFFIIQEKELY